MGYHHYDLRWMTLAVLTALLAPTNVSSLAVQMSIMVREEECLFEYAEVNEALTMSVIVLSGQQLKAAVTLDGPITPPGDVNAMGLAESSERYKYNPAKKHEVIRFSSVADFEHLNPIKNRETNVEDEEEEEVASEEETVAERRARRARERKRALEKRQREQEDVLSQKKSVREEGDPFQKTYIAKAEGWYRFCVSAAFYNVDVEIDFRRAKEFGGVGPDGHVYTLEEKTLVEEEKFMEEDTAAQEGIKDEDFQGTRDKLKQLRRLLADIANRQQKERHRIQLHSATNEHSHSRMVLSSLFQTILFCAVTGYQVFTIRRWFKGAPVLG